MALITVYQFLEELSNRDDADAVGDRMDWKAALSLELDRASFDHTVLSEFQTRLANGNAELWLLENFKVSAQLACCLPRFQDLLCLRTL